MMVKSGDRVGAILSVDPDTKIVEFLGYGVYEGQFPVEGLAAVIEAFTGEKADPDDILNPRIKLDDGVVVWGYQAWWAPEDIIRKKIERLSADGFDIKSSVVDPESYL